MWSKWQERKQKTDIFMPRIKEILGGLFIITSTDEEDQKYATDLRVLVLDSLQFGVRVRQSCYMDSSEPCSCYGKHRTYADDVTFRLSLVSGTKTEFEKIFYDKYCDFFFYGFGVYKTGELRGYTCIDLQKLRHQWKSERPSLKYQERKNRGYQDSDFMAMQVSSIRKDAIVCRYSFNKTDQLQQETPW